MENHKKHAADNNATSAHASQKRFKHFHPGLDPIEAEQEKRSDVQATPVSAHALSPVSRLYSDALGVVFDFLSLADLHRALSVSRSWSAAVCSMPRSCFVTSCTPQSVVQISSSRLARHISEFKCKLPSNEISFLALSMPHLNILQCEIIPSNVLKMILPAKLEKLELGLSEPDAAKTNAALEGIGRLTALHSLTMVLPEWIAEVSFAPLSKCAALKELTLREPPEVDWTGQLSDAQIVEFRALSHLRSVSIPWLSGASLTKLLRAPHFLLWTEMRGLSNVGGKVATALRNLPGLLSIETWDCRDVSFLPVMTHLQSLELQIRDEPWVVTGDAVVAAMFDCRQLTQLHLIAPVTSVHLSALLPQLPRLCQLALGHCGMLASLRFLSAARARSCRRLSPLASAAS